MAQENPANFAGNAAAFQAARLAEAGAAMALSNQYVKTMHATMGDTLQQWPDMEPKMNPAGLACAPGTLVFTVAVNWQQFGPFLVEQLGQLAAQGVFTARSLVWRQGMAGWQEAGAVPELVRLFPGTGAPPVPAPASGTPPPPSGTPPAPPPASGTPPAAPPASGTEQAQ